MSNEQEAVFAFLSDPATFGGAPVRRIDTHAASVFLAGERALKVKRAVKFPFLDYSTLNRRKAACEAEIAVNRPFAPVIYLRSVAIVRAKNGSLAIGGEGEPVEWAVEMRRFDENATLDRLAARGAIDDAMADRLGRMVARAHASAPAFDTDTWLGAFSGFLHQNDEALGDMPELFAPAEASALGKTSRAAFARLQPLLRRRGEAGFIRRCHGDLHLGNIALIDGEPVLFDAIEFDASVAAGDVLYDLCFLLADLLERALPQQANVVFNRYLTESNEVAHLDALSALPLFLSMRASIRAKVTAARGAGSPNPANGSEAQGYFRFACAAMRPPPARLVAIGGLSGTGKSLLARALAPCVGAMPGAVLLRSDVERKRLHGARETERLPPSAYTQDATAKVYATLCDKASRVLAAGHSALVDAVFADARERAAIESVAQASGADFAGLFLTADLDTRLRRVGMRANDPSDADAAVARRQEAYDLGGLGWKTIDASGSPDRTLFSARTVLA